MTKFCGLGRHGFKSTDWRDMHWFLSASLASHLINAKFSASQETDIMLSSKHVASNAC
jgi:hypothetical protein